MGSISTARNEWNVTVVSFPAQKKHRYGLTLKFDEDASQSNVPPPRVRIELDPFSKEDFIFAGAEFDSLALLLGIVGASMFSVSFVRARFKDGKTAPNLK